MFSFEKDYPIFRNILLVPDINTPHSGQELTYVWNPALATATAHALLGPPYLDQVTWPNFPGVSLDPVAPSTSSKRLMT